MSRAHPRPKTTFVTSAASPKDFPPPSLPELAVVGRSNVGKSSLINALVGQDGLARTSRTPGRTQLINWFAVGAQPPFHLVDLPGYGYAKVPTGMRDSWKPLIETYLSGRKTLAGVLLLIDIRRGPEDEELDFVPWLAEREVPIVVALTKADKLAKNKRMLEVMRARQALALTRDPFAVSIQTSDGVDAVWRSLIKLILPEMIIEPATTADLDSIDAIEQHSFKVPWPRSTFERELAAEWARIDVVRDPHVIAFINYWLVAGELHVLAIATHPDRRRAGIGGQLLAHAIAAARAIGTTLATLEVRKGNKPAIALYERAGFKTVHIRQGYYQDDGEDALVMLCALSPE